MDSKISFQNSLDAMVRQIDAEELQQICKKNSTLVDSYRQWKARLKAAAEQEQLMKALVQEIISSADYQKWLSREQKKDMRRKHKRIPADDGKRVTLFAASLKQSLPAVIPQAVFTEGLNRWGKRGIWRLQEQAHLTGLVTLDLDHLPNAAEVAAQWKATFDFAAMGIVWIFVTPGGEGVKVVFKARMEWGNLQDNAYEMAEQLGVLKYADASCKNADHTHFTPKAEDIVYVDWDVLMNYQNPDYEARYGEMYRKGGSGPTQQKWQDYEASRTVRKPDGVASATKSPASVEVSCGQEQEAHKLLTEYHGVPLINIALKLVELMGNPLPGDRHAMMMKMGRMLASIVDNDAPSLTDLMSQLGFVKEIVSERGEDVERHMRYICEHPSSAGVSAKLKEALLSLGIALTPELEIVSPTSVLPINRWADEIEALMDSFPCLREVCHGVRREMWPAVLFSAAAFLGTLMTRTWYHFYDDPTELCRLNYAVLVIGDPGAGKRFAKRLYNLLCSPIKEADKLGIEAENRYKKDVKSRATSTKEQKEAGLSRPEVVVRINGPRTSNSDFIRHMLNAKEEMNGEPWHLHLITFDAELDNTISLSKQGGWINRDVLELKQFHNEEDSQSYANLDAVNGSFNVFWNYIYTGTLLALRKKVTEGNFGSGLATRLAVIPAPPSDFKMIPLRKVTQEDCTADDTLRQWAYRLDQRQGELPLWPLVEHVWKWCDHRMEMAGFNQDRADEMLIKRIPYYGINIAAPFIDMRHWDEREKTGTYEIDDIDRRLCSLVLDIQYACQHFYFGGYASKYFEDQVNDPAIERRRTSRYEECYRRLPEEFTTEVFAKTFGYETSNSAQKSLSRFVEDKYIERTRRGEYKKLKQELT